MRVLKRTLLCVVVLLAFAGVALVLAGKGHFGEHESAGEIAGPRIPDGVRHEREKAQRAAAGPGRDKQILFGDLHVHTTFSLDAFFISLPAMSGEGAHPPADACDFARHCSALDFWSINDHAEGLSPAHWDETIESIQQCNAVAGDAANPDVVAFLGWEWTQVGRTPSEHYGHKNVVLRDIDRDRIPARPIASGGVTASAMSGVGPIARGTLALVGGEQRYFDIARYLNDSADVPACEEGVSTRELPRGCRETAETPRGLFRKLDEWGHEAIVIPHGTTWGFYTPPGSSWDKQLSPEQHDPDRQTLIEVYSGHGNSEEYRDFRAIVFDADGRPRCPEPTPGYLPTCWRAGEIIRERCRAAGEDESECDTRAAVARQNAAAAGIQAFLTVPGAEASEWLDAGQCTDCFQPAFNYRSGGAAQYIMALRRFDGEGPPRRFEFGFMASSDNHTARPGTGYKEYDRREMTEASGADGSRGARLFGAERVEPRAESVALVDVELPPLAFNGMESERGASFFVTGGLIAAHSAGRDRGSIWDAMQRREVYGTSGPRILLWFDLENGPDGPVSMGGATRMREAPRFRVRAAGSFEQKPGCPDHTVSALDPERLHHLCRDECYNPGDTRRPITRIEVVRVRPQNRADEPVGPLIEDPWRVIPCDGGGEGCTATFSDPEFAASGRDALYYVRAIEAPAPAVNQENLRCTRDESGRCVEMNPCWGDLRTPYQDDCLAEGEPRAWSSPVFVAHGGGGTAPR